MVHIDPVYEYVEPDCPGGEPTLADIAGIVPLLALHCFGARTLTFTPVQVRNEGAELSGFIDGTPAWLAEGGELTMYWLPDRNEGASLVIQMDPAAGIVVDEQVWAEVTGQFDHPAAQQCDWHSDEPELAPASAVEEVLFCRGRFVVTGARRLSDDEIRPRPWCRRRALPRMPPFPSASTSLTRRSATVSAHLPSGQAAK